MVTGANRSDERRREIMFMGSLTENWILGDRSRFPAASSLILTLSGSSLMKVDSRRCDSAFARLVGNSLKRRSTR